MGRLFCGFSGRDGPMVLWGVHALWRELHGHYYPALAVRSHDDSVGIAALGFVYAGQFLLPIYSAGAGRALVQGPSKGPKMETLQADYVDMLNLISPFGGVSTLAKRYARAWIDFN